MQTNRLFFLFMTLTLGLVLILLWIVPAQALPSSGEDTPLHAVEEANSASPSGSDLVLEKTVGLDSSTCATTEAISVTVGTTVYYCYQITNNTLFTLTDHTLEDSALGTVLNHFPFTLVPGASAFLTQSAIISTTTINTATWTAVNPTTSYSLNTGSCTFPDISLTGTPLNLSDDGETNVNLPFHFQYYDLFDDLLRVGNNGGVVPGNPNAPIYFGNGAFPTDIVPYLIAPFWDDLDDETGNVYAGWYTYTLAEGANHLITSPAETPSGSTAYYVVHWDEVSHFPGPSASTATFAVGMIKPGQGIDGYMFMCYPDTTFGNAAYDYGASATIGVNKDALTALQFSYNTSHPELTGTFGVGYIPNESGEAAAATDSAKVYVPPLTFDKTVGTDPSICATTGVITVTSGTEVYYCYQVRNTSAFTLSLHTLEDNELGTILLILADKAKL